MLQTPPFILYVHVSDENLILKTIRQKLVVVQRTLQFAKTLLEDTHIPDVFRSSAFLQVEIYLIRGMEALNL